MPQVRHDESESDMIWPEGVEKPVEVEEYEDDCLPPDADFDQTVWQGVADAALTACGQRIAELEREVERLNKLVKHAADTLLMLTECDGVDDD